MMSYDYCVVISNIVSAYISQLRLALCRLCLVESWFSKKSSLSHVCVIKFYFIHHVFDCLQEHSSIAIMV